METDQSQSTIVPPGAGRDCRRCVATFLGVTVTGLLLLAGLNVGADPFGAFGVSIIPADSRTGDTRTARAELLRRFTGETLLLGSSRTRIGYDGRLDGLPGGPACNVGLDGTHIRELALVVHRAAENPHVRRIVLSLDLHLFSGDWQSNSDFRCSRFNRERSELEHWCDLLWNGRTIEASCRALRRAARGVTPQHDELGFAVNAAARFERAAQDVRTRQTIEQYFGPRGLLRHPTPPPEAYSELQRIIALCRDREIELTLVLDPVHALLLEGLESSGGGPAYQDWKHELTRIAEDAAVPLWDFTASAIQLSEPLLGGEPSTASRWFWEPSHMRRELGDRVLRRVFSTTNAEQDFGVLLTSERFDEQSKRIEAARRHWLAASVREVAQLRALIDPTSRRDRPAVRVAGQPDEFGRH